MPKKCERAASPQPIQLENSRVFCGSKLLSMPEPTIILTVDDNDAHRYFVCRTLEQAGYQTVSASNGESAIRKAGDLPALIVLDVHLPDIDGYEVCRRLKADDRTRHIPIIMFSGIAQDGSAVNIARQLGAASFLFFPIAADHLLMTVQGTLMQATRGTASR